MTPLALTKVIKGVFPIGKQFEELYTLIRQLSGVSLLIYCMRGRVRENATFNWILFNRVICGEKVPDCRGCDGAGNL
jgi:hypothetical protein